MRLTMLGVGEAFDPVEASSAALVEAAGFTLLIDCGHAAVLPLWRARPVPDAIDAVYLTHHHADHVLGLVPVLDRWIVDGRQKPLTMLTTPWGIGHLQQLFGLMGLPEAADWPFPLTFQVAADTRSIGPFAVAIAPTRHSVPNHAIQLQAGGRCLAYSGDGRPTPESRALYAGADLLMHECFDAEAAPDNPFHCDLPTVEALDGPARIGLYHVKASQRAMLRQALPPDGRLFLPEAGVLLGV